MGGVNPAVVGATADSRKELSSGTGKGAQFIQGIWFYSNRAIQLLEQGMSKQEIMEKTGHTIALRT